MRSAIACGLPAVPPLQRWCNELVLIAAYFAAAALGFAAR